MGLLSYCLLPLLALAAVNAGTFTLQAPRFTISGPDAQQIRSETYVGQLLSRVSLTRIHIA